MASMCLKSVGFSATAWTLTRISLSEMVGTGISVKSTPFEKDFPTVRLASLEKRFWFDTRAFMVTETAVSGPEQEGCVCVCVCVMRTVST